jgi:ABC-type amino acid transport substrate-binding protein
MDASFPPFEAITSDGTLVGFDVDLARELGRRLGEGVEVQFVANLPYDGLYDALTIGRVDVVISALVVDPARMADFAYSISYFDAGQVLVVQEGASQTIGAVERMADLEGRTLAVALGSRGDLVARRWDRRLEGLTLVSYQTADAALLDVADGQADVALVDRVSALRAPDVAIIGDPVTEEPYAIAVQKESQRLLHAINEALRDMKADGTLEALSDKWLTGSS